jgi:glycosyltransferase involved in cell wall biosynthesis
MKPKISVIIPTRNRPEMLEVCLASLIGNKVEHETIIVDHYSDGDAGDRNKNIASVYPHTRYYYITRHVPGCYEPICHGLEKAQGEYIKIVGDDDALEPYTLDLEYNAIIHAGADALMTSYWTCDENLHIKTGYSVGPTVNLTMMRQGCFVPDATLFKKEIWEVPARAEKLYTRWLWAVWYQMIAKGYKFVGLPSLFSQRYRTHTGQISKGEVGREADNIAVKKIFEEIDAVCSGRGDRSTGTGNSSAISF